MAENKI